MSREVLGGRQDDRHDQDDRYDRYDRYNKGDLDDLDAVDDLDGPTAAPLARPPSLLDRWAVLLRRTPRVVASTLALVTGTLGWFTPELLAATSPPPPLVVATVGSDFEIDTSTANTAVLTLPVAVANLGQSSVTVTGGDAEGRPVQVALVIARGGTGQARLRLTPSCLGPIDPMVPRLRVSDPAGSVSTATVLGAARLLSLACGAINQQTVAVDEVTGPVVRVGAPTRRGDQLLLRLHTKDGLRLLLTSADAGDVSLTLPSGPVPLDGTTRDVLLQPPAECPPTLVASGPQTVLGLSLTASQPERSYVAMLEGVPEVAAWLLHTVCAGSPT